MCGGDERLYRCAILPTPNNMPIEIAFNNAADRFVVSAEPSETHHAPRRGFFFFRALKPNQVPAHRQICAIMTENTKIEWNNHDRRR